MTMYTCDVRKRQQEGWDICHKHSRPDEVENTHSALSPIGYGIKTSAETTFVNYNNSRGVHAGSVNPNLYMRARAAIEAVQVLKWGGLNKLALLRRRRLRTVIVCNVYL